MPSDAFLAQQYKPGQSGNVKGRPRKRPMSEAYDDLLRSPLPERERKLLGLKAGTLWCEAIALARGRAALTRTGTLDSKELREGVEGKAAQRFELSGPEGAAWEVKVIFEMPPARLRAGGEKEIIDVAPD